MDRLMDYYLDGELNKEEHEARRLELVQKRQEIVKEIELRNREDGYSFAKMLISLIETASKAYKTFIGSTVAEKRSLVNLVFANLTLKPSKLDYTVRSPFNVFIEIPKTKEWCTREESNP